MNTPTFESHPFMVRYYDPKLSKVGKGSQVRYFTNEADAAEFAMCKRYRAQPAKVEPSR